MKKRACLLVALLAIVVMGFAMSVEAAEIIDRGYCGGEGNGKNLTWTLDRDGVLVIEGQGKMKDWIEEEASPLVENYHPIDWHKHFDVIDSVIVQSGVTSIGNNAFRNCKSISNIVVPETVTSIGHEAFCDCASLNSIELPKSLRVMGYSAFSDCISLSSINLPESLTSMGDRAFSGCIVLKKLVIPDSVTTYGSNWISGCINIESLTLGAGAGKYVKEDGSISYELLHTQNPYVSSTACKMIARQRTSYGLIYNWISESTVDNDRIIPCSI